jgi:hypothetical protein
VVARATGIRTKTERSLGSAAMITELDVGLANGRVLHAYDTAPADGRLA